MPAAELDPCGWLETMLFFGCPAAFCFLKWLSVAIFAQVGGGQGVSQMAFRSHFGSSWLPRRRRPASTAAPPRDPRPVAPPSVAWLPTVLPRGRVGLMLAKQMAEQLEGLQDGNAYLKLLATSCREATIYVREFRENLRSICKLPKELITGELQTVHTALEKATRGFVLSAAVQIHELEALQRAMEDVVANDRRARGLDNRWHERRPKAVPICICSTCRIAAAEKLTKEQTTQTTEQEQIAEQELTTKQEQIAGELQALHTATEQAANDDPQGTSTKEQSTTEQLVPTTEQEQTAGEHQALQTATEQAAIENLTKDQIAGELRRVMFAAQAANWTLTEWIQLTNGQW